MILRHLTFLFFLCFLNSVRADVAVLTQHNDLSRTGANLRETSLNISNVNTTQFGLLYTRPVDDQIYAQPLILTNVNLGVKGTHNLVILATVNDTVYAFDADDSSVTAPYWTNSFLLNNPNIVPPRASDMTGACGGNYPNFSGNMGIVSTPVIDPVTGTIYVVARTKENGGTYLQKLHALDVVTGLERPNSPVTITAACPGNGDGSISNIVTFDPYKQNQRSGLALVNGVVYIGWASHCDWGPYHGWLIGYNASTLQRTSVYNTSPNGYNAGIWMSGQAPAADTNGNLYISVGNGSVGYGGNASNTVNRGESFLRLTPNGTNFILSSWFTPADYQYLENNDLDLGSAGVLLIPGTNLIFSGGKEGKAFLVNRDTMGGLSPSAADTNIVQSFQVTPVPGADNIHGGPVWWDGPDGSYAYVWGESDYLHQFKFDRAAGQFILPAYASSATAAPIGGMPGGILSVSANGTNFGSGIIWASHPFSGDANPQTRPGILHAYNAQNITNELWNSEQLGARDSVGNFAKYCPPTVANGKVYLATFSNRLNVYGLLPPSPPVILQQPKSTTRYSGDSVTFSMTLSGTGPLSYQWFNGTNQINGATNPAYSLINIQSSNIGAYHCTISNSLDSVTSSNASLNVIPAPIVTYSQAVLADNPIAYWRLDETNGTIANDFWGGYNGQYTNVTLGLPGYNVFDPDFAAGFGTISVTNSCIASIPIDFYTPGNATFSVEAWVKAGAQTSDNGIITKGYGAGGEQFTLDTGSGAHGYRFFVRDLGGGVHLANGTVGPNNTWQHLVGVCDEVNGYLALYVNGVTNAGNVLANGSGLLTSTNPLTIGSRQLSQNSAYNLNFVGAIDEVAVYNYALSPAQARAHYVAGTNLPPVLLNFQTSASQLQLSWPGGTLQSSTQAAGPYTNMTGVVSPYNVAPSGTMKFYRVKVR